MILGGYDRGKITVKEQSDGVLPAEVVIIWVVACVL